MPTEQQPKRISGSLSSHWVLWLIGTLIGLVCLAVLLTPRCLLRGFFNRPGSGLQVAGKLTAVAEVGGPHGVDPPRLEQALIKLDIAKLNSFYVHGRRWPLPEAVIDPTAMQGSHPPGVPESLAGREDLVRSNVVCHDGLCATVYSVSGGNPAACIVAIDSPTKTEQRSRQVILFDHCVTHAYSWITPTYDDGGFAVYLSASFPANTGELSSANILVHLPGSEDAPRICFDSRLAGESGKLIGSTVDGSEIYLRGADSVWGINPITGNTVKWPCPPDLWIENAIPSPEGRWIALSLPLKSQARALKTSGIWIIDTVTGDVRQITFRQRGNASDEAIAWSRSSPGRLYFFDNTSRLWQLDLYTSESTGASTKFGL